MADMKTVIKAIAEAEIPESAKSLFEMALPLSTVAKGESHPFQKEFLGLASNMLETTKQEVADALVDMETCMKDAEAALEDQKAARIEAEKVLEAAAAKAAEAATEEAAVAKVVAEAEAEHKAIEKDAQGSLEAWQAERQKLSDVRGVVDGPLTSLLEGTWEGEDAKTAAVETVVELLKKVHKDKTISAGAPFALAVKPEERQPFDQIVIDAVVPPLKKHLAELEAQVDASMPEEEEKKAEVLGLWAMADCARDEHVSAKRALEEAETTKVEASASLEAEKNSILKAEGKIEGQVKKRARLQTRAEEVEAAITAAERLATPAPAVEEEVVDTVEAAADTEAPQKMQEEEEEAKEEVPEKAQDEEEEPAQVAAQEEETTQDVDMNEAKAADLVTTEIKQPIVVLPLQGESAVAQAGGA